MSTSPIPPWLPGLVFTDPVTFPPMYRFDLVPGPGAFSKTVVLQRSRARIHSTLPLVDVWTYDGSYPGPAFATRRGQLLQITWANAIEGPYPARAWLAPDPTGSEPVPQNVPGDGPGMQVTDTVPMESRIVVHLHGGRTQADSDGWPDNTLAHGHANVSRYENDQQATLLWYHDHAMGITRYNVYAGLAGLWLIRDDEELAHLAHGRLPGDRHELILSIQDRNLATTDGTPTGPPSHQFLHKISDGTREFFGPFTLVNGTIWPHCRVSPRAYRVRVLNSSNARTYGLELRYVDGQDQPTKDPVPVGAVRQIGTDGGLLPEAVDLPMADSGFGPLLVLMPAERADLVIDFGHLAASKKGAGRRLAWFNTAPAPYGGDYLPPEAPADDAREGVFLKYHQVMRFDIEPGPPHPAWSPPSPLSPQYTRLAPADVADHPTRLIALLEIDMRPSDGGGTMLLLRELIATSELKPGCHAIERGPIPVEVDPATGQARTYQITLPGESSPRTYFVAAQNFYDKINWMVRLGDCERWRFLNLTGDSHPMHVHLVQFQVLDRTRYQIPGHDAKEIIGDYLKSKDPCAFPTLGEVIAPNSDGAIPPPTGSPDAGWNDTIRVDPNEMVSIAARFEPFHGRYMYHCHVVEHEDNDMMRPFVVAPDMGMGMGMGSMHPQRRLPAQPGGSPPARPRQ